MPVSLTPLSVLGPQAEEERQRIRRQFESGATARDTTRALCQFADKTVSRIFDEMLRASGTSTHGLSLLALGGYGRQLLFPYSDLDLLFLFGNEKVEQDFRPLLADFARTLWDFGFRVSSAGRTLEECKRIAEDNIEFHLAMLDRRYLTGDEETFRKLDAGILPAAEKQSQNQLRGQLQTLTKDRLARYGNTIFHLEPNVKEAPGGLRDYHATAWFHQLSGNKADGLNSAALEEEQAAGAVEFLSAIRCFLHYSNGRNDNTLTYELQAIAAERSLGATDGISRDAAEWMRLYFRHARTLNRLLLRHLEQKSASQSFRERIFHPMGKSKIISGKPFAMQDGVYELLEDAPFSDRSTLFYLFTEVARTGISLSRDAERRIAYVLLHPELTPRNTEISWPVFQEILGADYPGMALRSLQRLGLLTEILPEFSAIDSLVVRDFYHRYTVDEHTLRTIEHLQELAQPPDARGEHFKDIWATLNRRDLLILALLLHDTGKGMPVENHVTGSLQALETAAARLGLDAAEKDEVHFLIEHHLDMSATVQRRDIFDPATVSSFAASVQNPERLQRLCLLTYADIHAVNPEALTPWKAEMLWQLFAAVSNYFSRSLDTDRLHLSDDSGLLKQIAAHAKVADIRQIERFLEGFPRRYLTVHSAEEIAGHFLLYRNLANQPLQTELKPEQHSFSLTLLTQDRPSLFASISGVLAGWGLNIVKADAFANAAGIVLDTFRFTDPHRNLELNPSEIQRFEHNLADVLLGKAPLEPRLKGREKASLARPPKVTVETRISFDSGTSEHSTLLELVAQDRPGLLFDVASTMARLSCNIEVALIDTEGQKAIDVFYLTEQGRKLSPQKQNVLREALQGTTA